MREILFKAKRLDYDEWVEGFVFDDGIIWSNKMFIGGFVIEPYKGTACDEWVITGEYIYEVNPSTICQYTGLTDKNGNKIWENDVVSEDFGNYKGAVVFGEFASNVLNNLGFSIDWSKSGVYYRQDLPYWSDKIEVVGNIFDNPELLKGEPS